ncbi:MAG: universal stress protein, partial [Candidatus Rokuibacteriota bacterium]
GAREYQADLIAMTTHGRSGLSRLLFGSVAEAVLRRAHVPVFLAKSWHASWSSSSSPARWPARKRLASPGRSSAWISRPAAS